MIVEVGSNAARTLPNWTYDRVAELAKCYGFERFGFTWRISCGFCETFKDFPMSPTVNVSQDLVPTARQWDWGVKRGGLPLCPECRKKGVPFQMQHMKKFGFNSATQDEAIRDLQNYGVRLAFRDNVSCWECECACGAQPETVAQEYNPDLKTLVNTAVKKFNRIHWTVEFGKPPRCPTCTRYERGEPQVPRRDDRIIEGTLATEPVALPAPAPVEASVPEIGNKRTVTISRLLTQHFDDETKLFDPD